MKPYAMNPYPYMNSKKNARKPRSQEAKKNAKKNQQVKSQQVPRSDASLVIPCSALPAPDEKVATPASLILPCSALPAPDEQVATPPPSQQEAERELERWRGQEEAEYHLGRWRDGVLSSIDELSKRKATDSVPLDPRKAKYYKANYCTDCGGKIAAGRSNYCTDCGGKLPAGRL
jgi:hypothetical protein